MWLPGVLRQERRRRVRADRLSGFVIRRRIRGGSEVDRGDAALRHRGGRADSDPGRERGDGRRAGAPISCSIPAHASSRSCSNILAGTDLRPRLRKRCCANASCRSRPALIMRRGRSCGRCGETGWRSCRRARRSGGSCPDRARDRGAPQNRPKSAINRFTFDRPKVPDHLVMRLDTPRVVRRAGAAVPAQRRRHLQ